MDPEASIILVGVRGAGKRTLGLIAATELNWNFMTEDRCFKEFTKMTPATFVEKYGIEAFHENSVEAVRRVLLTCRERHVIECGWSSLTSDIHLLLQRLCLTNPVIQVTRSPKQVQTLLGLDQQQIALFTRAEETHRDCSNYEFYNIQDWTEDSATNDRKGDISCSPFRLKDAKTHFCSFLDLVRSKSVERLSPCINRPLSAIPLAERRFTHVVRVELSTLIQLPPQLDNFDFIEDAIELIDDVPSSDANQIIGEKVATLRRVAAVDRQDDEDFQARLLWSAFRLAVDYVVVPLESINLRLKQILSERRSTQLIGHCAIPLDADAIEKARRMYDKASDHGFSMTRLIFVKGTSTQDEKALHDCVMALRSSVKLRGGPALISYGQGLLGSQSMLLSNTILTPVHHPHFHPKADGLDSLMTTRQIMQLRFQKGLLETQRIYSIGKAPLSVAPAMVKAALDATGLSFDYIQQESLGSPPFEDLAMDKKTGGATITYGLKTITATFVEKKSQQAMAIGAINTLMPLSTETNPAPCLGNIHANLPGSGAIRSWYGDNTDWIGMTTSGLVIGSGGMARAAIYSMLRLGVHAVCVFNPVARDQSIIPDHFNTMFGSQQRGVKHVRTLLHTQESWPADMEQPTIIVSCPVPGERIEPIATTAAVPTQWLQSKTGGVILEMCYKPLLTPLLREVQNLRARTGQAWVLVNGLEMLTEQGSVQFELLTGRRAPRHTMLLEARKAYAQEELLQNI
ncbi:shikimate kinase domain-containing protein [Trichoderma breve]|uniref:Shikimate kinase domain-containing protein n=1 Tax=Trichoderma breve TaxID=2034170 RepID=A0A9W9E4Y5_9HYPO|nr:shikimate kinase domain-containing protein [Trichoderma breve]KAJ4856792.1 shikimate kinase domain-containing protein [Trichoderma breve]